MTSYSVHPAPPTGRLQRFSWGKLDLRETVVEIPYAHEYDHQRGSTDELVSPFGRVSFTETPRESFASFRSDASDPFKDPVQIRSREVSMEWEWRRSSLAKSRPLKTETSVAIRQLSPTEESFDNGAANAVCTNLYGNYLPLTLVPSNMTDPVQLQVTMRHERNRQYDIRNLLDGSNWYIGTSQMRKPDLVMHEGINQNGSVVGAAKNTFGSSTIDIAIGDPTDPLAPSPTWIKMDLKKGRGFAFTRSFTVAVPFRSTSSRSSSDSASSLTELRKFAWKRTRNSESLSGFGDISLSRLSARHLKLIDTDNGKVVAVYVNNPLNWENTGIFYLQNDLGRDWETAVVLSGMMILENMRRGI